jgi:hypothetical protein
MKNEPGSPHRVPRRDDLLQTLHLCLRGERVLTTRLRQELAARGLDLEAFAASAPAGRRPPFDTAGPLS